MNCIQWKYITHLLLALVVLCAGPARGEATDADLKTIVLLETMPVPVVLAHSRWFITELEELGYEEGRNMRLVTLRANGDRARAEQLLNSTLKKSHPDIVVTNATMASQAATKILKGADIPILFMTVSDPVGAGLIVRPGIPTGNNLTGRINMINRETRINMAMRLVDNPARKDPVRIGFIHSSYPSSVGDIRKLRQVAQTRSDVIFMPYRIPYRQVPAGLPGMPAETRRAITALEEKVDFWWEPAGPLGELSEYTALLLAHSEKPILMGTKLESVKLGALLHLTPSIEGSGRETARLADAILKGANPGSIPPVPPSAFDLGINLGSAIKLSIVVPPDLLKLAGKHVYR